MPVYLLRAAGAIAGVALLPRQLVLEQMSRNLTAPASRGLAYTEGGLGPPALTLMRETLQATRQVLAALPRLRRWSHCCDCLLCGFGMPAGPAASVSRAA